MTPHKKTGKPTARAKKPLTKISRELRDKIMLAYLTGKSVDDICKLYNITKGQFNSLRTKHGWKQLQKAIDDRTTEQTVELLASKKKEALLKIATDAEDLMDLSMKRIRDQSQWEDVVIEDEDGNVISQRKVFNDIYALARTWNLGVSRLLRALGEPDTIRDLPVDDGSNNRPVFKVLMNVGLKPEFREKIINGDFKNGTDPN